MNSTTLSSGRSDVALIDLAGLAGGTERALLVRLPSRAGRACLALVPVQPEGPAITPERAVLVSRLLRRHRAA